MIRRSKTTLKFATQSKLNKLELLFQEYARYINLLINMLWEKPIYYKNHKYLDKDNLRNIDTWLSARLKQNAGKQALQIIRSQTNNSKKEKFKPEYKGNSIDLDERFIDLKSPKQTKEFDAWLHIQSLGNKIILDLPIKFHKHFNNFSDWTQNKSIRLIRKDNHFEAEFFFEKKTPSIKQNNKILAIDIGINKLITTSNKQIIGTEIKNIINKLHKRKQKSKNWHQTIKQIKNYIGQCVNQLDLSDISILVMEQLIGLTSKKNGKNNKTTRKLLGYWNRALLELRIQLKCQLNRVQIIKVDPAWTSCECSICHHISKRNRQGENFQCVKCGHTQDADENASLNILDRYRQLIVVYA